MPVFDKQDSRIKMVVLTSGKKPNITWYSILDKDKGDSQKICIKMIARFKNYLASYPTIQSTINKINFYEKGIFIGEATVN